MLQSPAPKVHPLGGLRELVGPDHWPEFVQLVETGEATPDFKALIERSDSLRKAIDIAFKAQVSDLKSLTDDLQTKWDARYKMSEKDLSADQLKFINEAQLCPDCEQGKLLEGPWGGSSVNVKCSNTECGHEYWLGTGLGTIWAGGRLDRDEPGLYSANPLTFAQPPKKRRRLVKTKIFLTLLVLAVIAGGVYLWYIP
jgi:hypothetical protein